MSDNNPAGWTWPPNAKKTHYFRAGETLSICGRWWYHGPHGPVDETAPHVCAACLARKNTASRRHQNTVRRVSAPAQ